MNRKKILLFSGLVAIVAGYAVYDFQQERSLTSLKEDQSRLVFLKAEQINFVEFDTRNGKFTLEKNVDGWFITSPIKDNANSSTVDQFVQALVTEKSKDMIDGTEQKPLDLAGYGLDQPLGSITIKDNIGDSRKIAVGTVKNYQGDAYVRIDDRNEVALAGSTWFSKVDKKVGDFRDLRFLRASAVKVQSFKIQKGSEVVDMVSKDGNWSYVKNPSLKLDQNRVREFVTALTMAEAIEVIQEKDIKPAQLQGWGLANPAWKVSLELSEAGRWEMSVAEGKDKISRAYVTKPEFILKIAPTEKDRFIKYDLDHFRDRSEPFRFDKQLVKNISVKTNLKSFDMVESMAPQQTIATWKLAKEVPGFELNQDGLIDFINRLNTFEVYGFTNLKSHPSLDKNSKVIVLKSVDNKDLFTVTIGEKTSMNNENIYYAKTSLFSEIFTISEEDYNQLKIEQLLQPKETDTSEVSP